MVVILYNNYLTHYLYSIDVVDTLMVRVEHQLLSMSWYSLLASNE